MLFRERKVHRERKFHGERKFKREWKVSMHLHTDFFCDDIARIEQRIYLSKSFAQRDVIKKCCFSQNQGKISL